MAEFVQTMKDWQRMCNDCTTTCNLFDGLCKAIPGMSIQDLSDSDISEIEEAVVAWAAEHPEPVYPTFGEWLEKQGIVKLVNSDRYEEDGRKVYILLESVDNQIPADIAQKLGIKPKGVK